MPKRPQAYYRPQELAEALRLLENPQAAPLGGGTRLLAGDIEPESIVDLQALGLNHLDLMADQLRIGATVRLYQLYESNEISGGACELLRQAIYQAGPNTFRNAATLGGIIASREASSELLALLLVLEAKIMLVGKTVGEMALGEYLSAEERPAGLITEIMIPWQEGKGALVRVARTPADAPIVAVAAWRVADEAVRLAATGIQARPLRLPDGDFWMAQTIEAAQALVTHPGDFLGSTDYRRAMLGVLVGRAIEQSLA